LLFADTGRLSDFFDGQTSGGSRFAQAETCFFGHILEGGKGWYL
jgi:hypothetical protein